MIDLHGKTILITGAESGIGRAIALTCADLGASLCLAGIGAAELEITRSLAGAKSEGRITAVTTDISDPEQVEALFARIDADHGGLDGVVANAGIILQSGPAHETSLADWKRTLDVNATGTFLTVSAAARYLVAQGRGGCILATGSSTAVRVVPNAAAYVASKGAVHALMQSMALDLAPHRIRVNVIVPGPVDTPPLRAIDGYIAKVEAGLPLGEVTQPVEIARLVAFALSDAAPHMTGTHLKIDSGRTIA